MDGHSIQVTSTGELWKTQSSGALPRLPCLSRYAWGLHNLLATFGGRAGVIGWSMGGIVALETAREYPGLLQRLVIISGTARLRLSVTLAHTQEDLERAVEILATTAREENLL